MTTPAALTERLDAISDLVRSIEDDHYPEPLDYVQALRMIRETADSALPHAVQHARAQGETWERIARYLGTSRQAAHERFAPDEKRG